MLELMERSGMRAGEVLNFTPADIQERSITIESPKYRRVESVMRACAAENRRKHNRGKFSFCTQIAAPPNLQRASEAWPEVEVKITIGNIDR